MTNEEEQRARMKEEIDSINAVNNAGRDGKIAFETSLESEPYKYHLYQEMRFDELLILETREMHETLKKILTILKVKKSISTWPSIATPSYPMPNNEHHTEEDEILDSDTPGESLEEDPAINEVDPSQKSYDEIVMKNPTHVADMKKPVGRPKRK